MIAEICKELLRRLQEKYGETEEYAVRLKRRYGPLEEEVAESVFCDDVDINRKILNRMLATSEKTFAGMRKSCSDMESENISVINRMFEKFKDEINKILQKDVLADGEKLAAKITKIIKKTLIKLWVYRQCRCDLEKYFRDNGIGVRIFEKGDLLTDDKMEYLDDALASVYSKKTEDPAKNFQVIKMVQPIILVGYEDDEEVQYQYVGGICEYYTLRN